MARNYLLEYSEQLATEIEMLCRNIKAPSNTLFQIRKSSSSIYANIREANYGQSKPDMLSKFEIALKECSETEGWLKLLLNSNDIDEDTYKQHRNLCGRIRRMLIASCKTMKDANHNLSGEITRMEALTCQDLLGKILLIGITYYTKDDKFIEQKQLWGTVTQANENGIVIRQKDGNIFSLPPDLRSTKPAPKGEYRLRSTGEVVVDPDYTSVWIIHRHPDDRY